MIAGLAIVAGSFWITLSVLRYMNSGATATRVAFDSFYINPGSSFSGDNAERLLTTSAERYAYAALAPLPFPPDSTRAGKIRARLQVLQGQLGILAVERIGGSLVIGKKAVDVTAGPVEVEVDLADVSKARQVVLWNLSPNGTSARARIWSIEAVF